MLQWTTCKTPYVLPYVELTKSKLTEMLFFSIVISFSLLTIQSHDLLYTILLFMSSNLLINSCYIAHWPFCYQVQY